LKSERSRLALIELEDHDDLMFGLVLLVFVLVVGPLAVFVGADSRVDEVGRRRSSGR